MKEYVDFGACLNEGLQVFHALVNGRIRIQGLGRPSAAYFVSSIDFVSAVDFFNKFLQPIFMEDIYITADSHLYTAPFWGGNYNDTSLCQH